MNNPIICIEDIYLCKKCNRFYIHRCDFKTHCIKIHQKLILDPSEDYVIYGKPSTSNMPSANTTHTNPYHSIENTTNILLGQNQPDTSTAQWDTLRQDLMLSDSESDSPKLTSIATNTTVQINPSDNKEVNTSPILIRDLTGQTTHFTTHSSGTEDTEIFIIPKKPSTQIGGNSNNWYEM